MDNGQINADTTGNRTAGEITVEVKDLILKNGSRISSDSGFEVDDVFAGNKIFVGNGQGGNININASNSLFISGVDSTISTNTLGEGQGAKST
ncbi:MAG: hypothetical protein R3F37_03485 [Candidatus Competibacteraceae bacterium]